MSCRGGVSAFEVESHAAEATQKADELFNNDQVPAFQKDPAARSPESTRRMGGKGKKRPGVGLEVQKHLAWSAMHLLFYLELTCQKMAKHVSMGPEVQASPPSCPDLCALALAEHTLKPLYVAQKGSGLGCCVELLGLIACTVVGEKQG